MAKRKRPVSAKKGQSGRQASLRAGGRGPGGSGASGAGGGGGEGGAGRGGKGGARAGARGKLKAPRALSEAQKRELERCRTAIGRIDANLVKLLNERSRLVVSVGKVKRSVGLPIYVPNREVEVLERVTGMNRGPLPDKAVEGVFREIMSASFALQRPTRIGYLGPAGSHSHVAATRHFGSSVAYEDLHEVRGVFTEVQRGHVDYGLVPIENSIGGGIVDTLDAFLETRSDVTIYAEVLLEVHHSLLANCEPAHVRRIHSKPEVFSQCRHWLATQYPRAELIAAASSSRAVVTAKQEFEQDPTGAGRGSAAIGSALAGSLYGMNTLFERIEDNPHNITRFFIIARHSARRTGDDKTSLMFTTQDKPGALVSVLAVFERAGINLSHIDKRPTGRTHWRYTFFLDTLGHMDDPWFASAVAQAKGHCEDMVILGSYPRARRIL